MPIQIVKKDKSLQNFNPKKIIDAIRKSADRACVKLDSKQEKAVVDYVCKFLIEHGQDEIEVSKLHNIVENALDTVDPKVAKCYRDYRNYKTNFFAMIDKVYQKKLSLSFIADRSNANADSALVTTQKAIVYNELNTEFYKKFFLNEEERKASDEGYIYIHDKNARLDTMNCFERSTRFITSEGVKSFYDFCEGDELTVLSHTGKWRKARVLKLPWAKLQTVTLSRGKNDFKVNCTLDHRWILKDGSETTCLKVGDKLAQTPNVFNIDTDSLSLPMRKLWCLGFSFADGYVPKKAEGLTCMSVLLCGHKIEYADMFRKCGYTVKPVKDSQNLIVYMPDVHSKTLPYNMDHEKISVFMNGYISADGNRYNLKDRGLEYRGVYVAGKANDWMYDFLNISGCYVTKVTDYSGKESNYGKRKDWSFGYDFYNSTSTKTWHVKAIDSYKLNPKANVWCLDVEEDHSFLLEGGIPTGNCCIYNMEGLMKGGFKMGNLEYGEPKTLDVAFDLMCDVAMNAASAQYGGFTIPEVDKLLGYYAEKSYNRYVDEYRNICSDLNAECNEVKADEYAYNKVKRDIEQGVQGMEMKFNSVASSRGDYPFTAVTFGLGTKRLETLISSTFLKVRKEGQGKEGFKRPVLFPKLSFFYDEDLHGTGKELEWLFDEALDCSSKSMYPDFISLSGEGYAPTIYKKYKTPISRMGCRATLAAWYERGGMNPLDDNDKPIYVGRFNCGAIALNFPMIAAKAKEEHKDFYEVLDYYLELVRGLHIKTIEFLSHKKAGINPLGFCEGGFIGCNKDPEEEIGRELLKPMTISFGIIALNEASVLETGKSIAEDDTWAYDVMKYINKYVDRIKYEDNILYAIYGVPGETAVATLRDCFVKKYGIIPRVSDKPYFTNSFHCAVYENITPIHKQDSEFRCFHLTNGGNINYCRYPIQYNKEAIKSLVKRAMLLGYYEGVNMSMDWCKDCGHQFIDLDECPKCGSKNVVRIERMNGYLGYAASPNGNSFYNDAKMAEFKDRISM